MPRSPAQKPRRIWNRLRIALLVCAVAGLTGGSFLYAVLYSGAFLSLRQSLAAQAVGTVLSRQVEVRGPVEITLGHQIKVQIEDAYVERSSGSEGGKARVFEKVRFDAGYRLLTGNFSSISNYEMSGADLVIRAGAMRADSAGTPSYARLPSQIINSAVLDNFDLSDVTVSLVDDEDGWNETLVINTLRSVGDPESKQVDLVLDASYNGTPFQVSGSFPSSKIAQEAYRGPFDLTLTIPGLESRISGAVDTSSEIAGLDGELASSSASIKTLLASLGLESDLAGHGTLTADFAGPLDQLSLSGIEMDFENEIRDRVKITGAVSRSLTTPEVDLHFNSALSPPVVTSDNRFAVNIEALEGSVSGPLNALTVDDVLIRTDAVLLDFDEIGPISVGRVVKHPDNTVGLEDLVIRDGPLDAPYMTLRGQMSDLIAFSGLDLKGSYRFPTALLLGRPAASVPELGFVAGNVALNNASGTFGLEELTGAVEASDLLTLGFQLAIPEFRVIDELRFSTDLTMPNPADVLEALGAPHGSFPTMAFLGSVAVTAEGARLDGALTSGATEIEAALTLSAPPGTRSLALGGGISSAKMDLTDVAKVVEFTREVLGPDDTTLELRDELQSVLTADLEVAVKEIVAGRKKAGNLTGHVTYEQDNLKVNKLRMTFLGGTVRGDFGVDLGSSPEIATAHGRMEKFPLKSLMAELGLSSPISSTVYASFDVTGTASSETAFLKSLSGNLTASLWGGTLPNRMLDLAGLSVFTWLVTGNADGTTKLVCAVLPLHFRNGSASGKSLIVETPNVQVVGAGSVNFRSGALNLSFVPRAKRKQLVEIVSPFDLGGTLKAPKLTVHDAGPGRAVGEVLATPLNLIGHIFTGSRAIDEDAKPCRLPKNTKPK
ncbi:AsmA-like C-terminal region-containing protein [Roseibium sp.]|uniref:AsmA family protein n=1 Tax=Roseibium sp. TaxID=1936156 RepID=UPI003BB22105